MVWATSRDGRFSVSLHLRHGSADNKQVCSGFRSLASDAAVEDFLFWLEAVAIILTCG